MYKQFAELWTAFLSMSLFRLFVWQYNFVIKKQQSNYYILLYVCSDVITRSTIDFQMIDDDKTMF